MLPATAAAALRSGLMLASGPRNPPPLALSRPLLASLAALAPLGTCVRPAAMRAASALALLALACLAGQGLGGRCPSASGCLTNIVIEDA